jgi:hypothetical protein
MNFTDEEYFEVVKSLVDLLPSIIGPSKGFALTDTEKFVAVKQAKSFNVNIEVGQPVSKGGIPEKVMKTRTEDEINYPKELFGVPINSRCSPIINRSTNNVLGAILCSTSLEKEHNVIQMANDLNTYSEQLTASAQEMASSSTELSTRSQSAYELINKTSMEINKMDEILNYITQISNTTNMLGLNAAIEAARAGEHGKGFSVVAKEIRNLATQSKTSVVNIAENLKIIKNDINNVLEVINEFMSTSETQAAQSEELSSSSVGINELFSKLLEFAEKLNE